MPDPDQVSVTVNEYGFAEVTTLKLRQLNFAQGGVDPIIADVLVRHMAKSLDSLVRSVTDGATNVIGKNAGTLATNNSGTPFAVNSVAATDKLDSATVLGAVTLLRGRNALGRDGADNFVGLIHPDVAADIMTDTGWLSPHQYRDTTQLYNAEIGSYLGARFVTSNRCSSAANSGSVKVYNTYFLGRQALVEATIADAHVVVGPQVDKLRRFNPLGWLYHGGWSIFREDCIEIAKTASSLSGLS